MASTLPWKSPGASGEPTSAVTATVMSVGVTPMSLAWSVALHWSGAVLEGERVAGLLELLREHADAISNATPTPASSRDRLTCRPGTRCCLTKATISPAPLPLH